MNWRMLLLVLSVGVISPKIYSLDVKIENLAKEVIKTSVPLSTGLENVFVASNVGNGTGALRISGVKPQDVKEVQIYSNLGGGYAQEISYSIDNGELIINTPKGDCGYIIVTESGNICFWLVDYSKHEYNINSLQESEVQECDITEFIVNGNAEVIRYYSISGQPCVLSRDIVLSYKNLEWDESALQFVETELQRKFDYLDSKMLVTPAMNMRTEIVLSGDQFLTKWGEEKRTESYLNNPNGINVKTVVEELNASTEEDSNRIKFDGDMLGGSAPAEFNFNAYVTEAVLHYEWQISEDPNFEYIKYRFNDKDLNYTFYDEGTYYVKFIGSNDDGSCEVEGDQYSVAIGASDLRIPNAFSPNGDGVNDEWKVGYISLVEFKCWIFDKNGHQLHYFDNPALGWDGKYKGKVVSPGVYYYVIEAKGADGKKYKRGGDINIVGYKKIGERE